MCLLNVSFVTCRRRKRLIKMPKLIKRQARIWHSVVVLSYSLYLSILCVVCIMYIVLSLSDRSVSQRIMNLPSSLLVTHLFVYVSVIYLF